MGEQVGGPRDGGMALAERDLGDRDGQLRRHLANLRERRKKAALIEVLLRHLRSQRRRSGEEHLVGDAA